MRTKNISIIKYNHVKYGKVTGTTTIMTSVTKNPFMSLFSPSSIIFLSELLSIIDGTYQTTRKGYILYRVFLSLESYSRNFHVFL